MKIILKGCLVFFLLIMGNRIIGADDTLSFTPKHTLSIDGFWLRVGIPVVEYEKVVDPKTSRVFLGAFISAYDPWTRMTTTGGALGVKYRKYFSKNNLPPKGAYWGVGIHALGLSASRYGVGIGAGYFLLPAAEIGYRWLFKNGLLVGVGGEAGIGAGSEHEGNTSSSGASIIFWPLLNIGYAW